jgi:hypothetical protein
VQQRRSAGRVYAPLLTSIALRSDIRAMSSDVLTAKITSAPAPPKLPVHPPATEPSASSSNAAAGAPPDKKPPNQMTKAERRELQEKQRAAKAAAKADGADKPAKGPAKKEASGRGAGGSGVGSGARGGQDTARERTASGAQAAPRASTGAASTSAGAGGDDGAARSRGLRIFAHFALQRPQAHVARGDVHPTIVRLGLLFAGFRICGANARCIATLGAFKEVRAPRPFLLVFLGRSSRLILFYFPSALYLRLFSLFSYLSPVRWIAR